MTQDAPTGGADSRERILDAAATLLASGGPGSVTTRAVSAAAGVQAPTIYRLFGDKIGLLTAVAERDVLGYLDRKRAEVHDDPVEHLRAGWDLTIGFGLANPESYRLMHAALRQSPAVAAGFGVLGERVHRIAATGRLRVPERRAVELITSTGTGVVLTLIGQREADRDPGLADAAWDALSAALLVPAAGPEHAPRGEDAATAAAVTLGAALPGLTALSEPERMLLREWLDRIAAGTPQPAADTPQPAA